MKTITVAGDDLFHIAAAQLADATQWIRIAELNKLSDPLLVGVTTLLIPDGDSGAEAALPFSSPSSVWRAPRLQVIANGQIVVGAMEAEVISNNYYAADRFNISIA